MKTGARSAPAREEEAFRGSSRSGWELNPRHAPLEGPARIEAATDPGRLAADLASSLGCRRGREVRAGAASSGCSHTRRQCHFPLQATQGAKERSELELM